MAEGLAARLPVNRLVRAIFAVMLALCLTTAIALTWPDAPGTVVIEDGGTVVDASNASLGYLTVRHGASDQALKVMIARGDDAYTYDLPADGTRAIYPLQMGSGRYTLTVYRQVKCTKYALDSECAVDVSLADENAAFLCFSQYVWYTQDSPAVEKSDALCADLSSDRQRADAVFGYIVDHMVYNYMRALTVESGYLPNVDQVYADAMGICFDFASLMACMLRVQGVPTRVVIGYADETYHAWNEVLLGGEWVRYDPTAEITDTRVASYTAERYY